MVVAEPIVVLRRREPELEQIASKLGWNHPLLRQKFKRMVFALPNTELGKPLTWRER